MSAAPRAALVGRNQRETAAPGLGTINRLVTLFAPTTDAFVLAGPEPVVRRLVVRHSPGTRIDPDRHETPFTVSCHAPLAPTTVAEAFLARVAVSAPWASLAPQCAAFDVDWPNGLNVAPSLARTLGDHGVPSVIIPSEGGRAHVWVTLGPDAGLPPIIWRRAFQATLSFAGIVDARGIEVRPANDHPSGPFGGQSLRLPGSPHRRTGRRFPWLDAGGYPLGRTLAELVAAVPTATGKAIFALAELAPVLAVAGDWRCGSGRRADRSTRYLAAALVGLCDELAATGPGARNRAAFAAAARARRLGVPPDVAGPELVSAAMRAGLAEREARAAVRSGLGGRRSP